MKIDFWPLDSNIANKNIKYEGNDTIFHIDIMFRTDDKIYHIVQQFIDLYNWDEELDNKNICSVIYSNVNFCTDAIDLSPKEITDILVSFLAHYKLYLHHYSITKQETFVSYISPKKESNKSFDLMYEPAYRHNSIFIDAEVQLEDGVDYYELLDIKMKKPVDTISGKRLRELGYEFHDYGIYSFAILDDKESKEYLVPTSKTI